MDYSEEKLWDQINDGWSRMSRDQKLFWDAVKILPTQWELRGHGPYWVVGLIGQNAVYFNHQEGGFNRSAWRALSILEHYQSMQWGLHEAIANELDIMRSGYNSGPKTTGPLPGEFKR